MKDLLEELRALYPSNRFFDGSAELASYESDGLTAFRARPMAVVLPESREEIIQTVRLCYETETPFVARGSGTSLSGGSMPIPGGIVIGLNRMNRILRLDPEEMIAVVEAGVINLKVSEAAAPYGLYYAPDPSSQQICTIGGNIAFNSGGAHCLKYGMTTNHVLKIVAVLPDGEVVELGDDGVDTAGPDLVGIYCGSEGLFGIALEITLRLLPKPEHFRTILAAYESLAQAGDAVSAVVSSGILPGAMEIMDNLSIQAVETAVNAGYPTDAAALLLVELDGEKEAVDSDFELLDALVRETGAYEIRVARDAEERARFWKGRKSAFSAVGRLSREFIVQDGVVPRARLGEALGEIQRLSEKYRIRVANVFHAGDGNLHPLILFDSSEERGLERAEELAGEILRLCIRLGGSITGEHGVGMEKRNYLEEMFSANDIAMMKRLRKVIDDREISNRGKMLTDGEAPSLSHRGLHPLEEAGTISRV